MYCSSFESADSIKSENPEPLAGCWLLNIYSTAWCWHWVTFPTRSAGLSTLLLQQSRAYAVPFVTQNPTVNIASMNSIWWCSLRDIYIFYTYLPSSPLPLKMMLGGGGVWMWWVWAITSQCLMLLQIDTRWCYVPSLEQLFLKLIIASSEQGSVRAWGACKCVFISVFCMSFQFAHCRKWYHFHLITH